MLLAIRVKVHNTEYSAYRELYEAERWHNDPTYWTPMVVLTNGQHIFIGDIFEYTSIMGSCLGKVKRFIHMVGACILYYIFTNRFCGFQKNSDSLRVVFHEIVEDASTGCYLIALDDNLIISIDSIDRLSTLSFTRDGTARLSEDGTVSTLNDTVCEIYFHVFTSLKIVDKRNGKTSCMYIT